MAWSPGHARDLNQDWLARFNGHVIKPEEFQEHLTEQQRRNPDLKLTPAAKRELLEKFVERKLLVAEAEKLKIEHDPDFQKTLQEWREQQLIKELLRRKSAELAQRIEVEDADIEQLYAARGQVVRYRYLLVAEADTAAQLLAAWRQGKPPPGLVDTGMVRVSSLDKSLQRELQKIPDHQPHLIQIGPHSALVEVVQRERREAPSLPQVRAELVREITEQKKVEMLRQWINDLKQRSRIELRNSWR
jgi:hypothetical protein